jgi:putative flippase GtrA
MTASQRRQNVARQFFSFAGVGIVGTAAHYLALLSLIKFAYVRPVAASSAGFMLGALVNYGLNYCITFHSQKRHREAMVKFFAVALVGLVLNFSIMKLGTEVLTQNYLVIQVIATGIVLTWNFIANRSWTFGV